MPTAHGFWGALEETEAVKREERVECSRFQVSSRMFIAAKLSVLIGRFVCCAAELLSNTPPLTLRGEGLGLGVSFMTMLGKSCCDRVEGFSI